MNPSLKEQLLQLKTHQQQQQKKQPARKPEKLSDSDLRYLMGVNMQILKRGKGGAWKR